MTGTTKPILPPKEMVDADVYRRVVYMYEKAEIEKEYIRKETAKEILQTLYNNLKKQPQFFKVYIETLSAKYGVEVEL